MKFVNDTSNTVTKIKCPHGRPSFSTMTAVNFTVQFHNICKSDLSIFIFPDIRVMLAFEWAVVHLCRCFCLLRVLIIKKGKRFICVEGKKCKSWTTGLWCHCCKNLKIHYQKIFKEFYIQLSTSPSQHMPHFHQWDSWGPNQVIMTTISVVEENDITMFRLVYL
jgi:hypothetical protein